MPRIYLLGHAKCATTTMASDLRLVGAEWLGGKRKEAHLFDGLCGYNYGRFDDRRIAGCPAATSAAARQLLEASPEPAGPRGCSRPRPTVIDSSPSNIRLPGLPALVSGIYGDESSRLGFVLLVREPLACLQSYWYELKSHYGKEAMPKEAMSFKAHLKTIGPIVQQYKNNNYKGIESDGAVDLVYRSLYSLSLAPWLQVFRREQFLIIPMSAYVNSTADRAAILRRLAAKFGATIQEKSLAKLTRSNGRPGHHPSVDEELEPAVVASWYKHHFLPDISRLAALLVRAGPSVVEVHGYSGRADDAQEMYRHLCRALPCML